MKTYEGGCHCGRVRFRVTADLSGVADCNCSVCTKKGYFWAIARDDRPWSGSDPPAVAYSYAPGRGAVHALKLLEDYRGIVQCDGYAAYKNVANASCGKAITLAFCWAHLRRTFFDIAKDGNAPIASEALERIARLYVIENVLTKLVNLWPASRLDELMPWGWAAERATNKLAA